jgi:hypothetical protein
MTGHLNELFSVPRYWRIGSVVRSAGRPERRRKRFIETATLEGIMGAKKLKAWKPIATPVDVDWHLQKKNLTIFQVMTISTRSYKTLLEMSKTGVLCAVDNRKPMTFTPTEVLRVFFNDREVPTHKASNVQELKSEVKRRITKRKKGDLCL